MARPGQAPAQRVSKYGNHRVVVDGITFDSKREAVRYGVLCLMQRAGEISDLRLQVPFELVPRQPTLRHAQPLRYIADFTYRMAGALVVEDAKGVQTEAFKIKRRLMLHVHGIHVLCT